MCLDTEPYTTVPRIASTTEMRNYADYTSGCRVKKLSPEKVIDSPDDTWKYVDMEMEGYQHQHRSGNF